MSPPECGNCGRPVPDGAGLCGVCGKGLAEALRGVPGLLDDLLVTYSRQDRITSGGGLGAETSLPWREDIPRSVWELGNTLTTWVRDLGGEHLELLPPPRRYRDPDMTSAAAAALWLAEHVHLIRAHPAALEAHHDLTRAIGRARARTERPPPTVYRGPCSCGEELRAQPGAEIIQCNCGQRYDGVKTREWLLAQAANQLLTAPELSAALAALAETTVPVGRIRVWKARGMLEVRNWLHDGHLTLAQPHRGGDGREERCCRPLFRVGDATKLLGAQRLA